LFGWKVDADNPVGYRRIDTGSPSGIQGGIWPAPPQAPNFVQLFTAVEDVGAAVERAVSFGARVLIPPTKLPRGRRYGRPPRPAGNVVCRLAKTVGKRNNGGMALQFTTNHLEDSLSLFRYYKKLGEDAMAQVTDTELTTTLDGEMNSIALIVKHMAGNMRSRWTDFLTTDGEKPDRHRDTEFVVPPATRAELMKLWEDGWDCVWRALGPMSEADLLRTVTIRGENHSVMQAVNRQLAHYPYHIGQIVMLAKHFRSDQWKSLTVPRNKSAEYNTKVGSGEKSQR